MRHFILFLSASILFTSCVSTKKYNELQAQVEQLEATEKAYNNLSQNPPLPPPPEDLENPEVLELRRQLEEMNKEMANVKREIEISGMSEMSEEERFIMMEERQRQMEMETMKMHQENTVKKSEEAFGLAENHISFATRAAEGAMSKYDAPNVLVERVGSLLVISVKDDILFSADRGSISASGETFVNRMKPVLEICKDLNVTIYGIAENDDKLEKAMSRALVVDEAMKGLAEYKNTSSAVGALTCKNARSGRKTNCDKVEIVFQADFEQALDLMRTGQ